MFAAETTIRVPSLHPNALACVELSIINITALSRTFQGESNTDVSSLKEPLLLLGDSLATKVKSNFQEAVRAILEFGPFDIRCESDAAMLLFETAVRANEGLLHPARPILRGWETGFDSHAPVARIGEEFGRFAAEFSKRWPGSVKDPIGFAAWAERASNANGHFFTDGCGRIARAIATAVLARSGLIYPNFRNRSEYFELIVQLPKDWEREYRKRCSSISQ